VLLPYFAVMIVLALYGVHRYTMCYLYFKYRKNYNPNPPNHFNETAPSPGDGATAHLQRSSSSSTGLSRRSVRWKYPHEKLEIQVLDDSTDETCEVASGIVERYAALGHPIVYIHRTQSLRL